MKKSDIQEEEDAEREYGDRSLEDAFDDRRSILNAFGGIIAAILNRDK